MRLFLCAFILLAAFLADAGEITKKSVPLSELKAHLSFRVFVPRFTPEGFKFSKAEIISEAGEPDKFSPNYAIEYCNLKNDCYTFESGSEFGDEGGGTSHANGKSKLLGTFELDFFLPNTEGNNTLKNYVISSWMPEGGEPPRRYHLLGNGISLKDASKIIESLEMQ